MLEPGTAKGHGQIEADYFNATLYNDHVRSTVSWLSRFHSSSAVELVEFPWTKATSAVVARRLQEEHQDIRRLQQGFLWTVIWQTFVYEQQLEDVTCWQHMDPFYIQVVHQLGPTEVPPHHPHGQVKFLRKESHNKKKHISDTADEVGVAFLQS